MQHHIHVLKTCNDAFCKSQSSITIEEASNDCKFALKHVKLQLKLIEIAEPLTTLQEVTQAERNGNKIDM